MAMSELSLSSASAIKPESFQVSAECMKFIQELSSQYGSSRCIIIEAAVLKFFDDFVWWLQEGFDQHDDTNLPYLLDAIQHTKGNSGQSNCPF